MPPMRAYTRHAPSATAMVAVDKFAPFFLFRFLRAGRGKSAEQEESERESRISRNTARSATSTDLHPMDAVLLLYVTCT
jgi:hypothetical protein